MTKVHKRLRRQNAALVLTSLALAAVLLITSVIGFAPTVKAMIQEQQRLAVDQKLAEKAKEEAEAEAAYWNPNESRFVDYATDLQLTVDAYNELFCPGYDIAYVKATKTGFASYTINIHQRDLRGEADILSGTLIENELDLSPELLYCHAPANIFSLYHDEDAEPHLTYVKEKLSALPEYVETYTVLTFAKDLSIKELIALKNEYEINIYWAAIAIGEKTYGPCGMDIFSGGGLGYPGIESSYPDFDAMYYNSTPEQLENHFKSLLKYSADRVAEGKGITLKILPSDFYTNALNYVEEHGVYSYGCYATGSPDELLRLLGSGLVRSISLEDAWIEVE